MNHAAVGLSRKASKVLPLPFHEGGKSDPPKARSGLMRTIMIVDDDPRLCSALQLKFEQAGYQVSAVGSGRDLLARLQIQQPDLIVLDLMMPDMSGIDVLEYLRSHPNLSSIPVVVVTAWGHTAMQVRCLELGAADFVSKPFSLRELAARVEEHLA